MGEGKDKKRIRTPYRSLLNQLVTIKNILKLTNLKVIRVIIIIIIIIIIIYAKNFP